MKTDFYIYMYKTGNEGIYIAVELIVLLVVVCILHRWICAQEQSLTELGRKAVLGHSYLKLFQEHLTLNTFQVKWKQKPDRLGRCT